MESKIRRVLGSSFVLERKELFSIETSERVYFKNTRLYRNPLVPAFNKEDASIRSSSSSLDVIEKIHRTRERLDRMNDQISHEIDRLKEVHDSFKHRQSSPARIEMTSKKHMTWGESLSANRAKVNPLTGNRQQIGPGRTQCPGPGNVCKQNCRTVEIRPSSKDDSPKPASKELKQNRLTPTKPPPKGPSPKGPPLKGPPSKGLSLKSLPSKGPPLKGPQSKGLPLKSLPPKEPSTQDLPKSPPAKELAARKQPPKSVTQKELKAGNPPSKTVTTRKPLPKHEPVAKELTHRDFSPKELPPGKHPPKQLAARVSGGCCWCDNYDQDLCSTYQSSYGTRDQSSYGTKDRSCRCGGVHLSYCPNYNAGLTQDVQYGVPYSVSPRRHGTDLNTEDTCTNRCCCALSNRNITPKEFWQKDKEDLPTAYKVRSQEKLLKVEREGKLLKIESRDKITKVERQGNQLGERSREKQLKTAFHYPAGFKREKPTVRAQKTEDTDSRKDKTYKVNKRMYQNYLNSYYQENSKDDIRTGNSPGPTPTYTRSRVKEEKRRDVEPKPGKEYLNESDRKKDQPLSKTRTREKQSIPRSKDTQREVVRPQIFEEDAFSDPERLKYKAKSEENNNRTDYNGTRRTDIISENRRSSPSLTSPIGFHDDRYFQPSGSHQKSTRSQDTDRQMVKEERTGRSKEHDVVRQERTERSKDRDMVREVPKSVYRDRSAPPMESESTHIINNAPLSVKRQRQENIPQKEIQRPRQENISSHKDIQRPRAESTKVYKDPKGRRGNLSPISLREGSFQIAECASTDSSTETIVMNPNYQPQDSQSLKITGDPFIDSDEESVNSDDDPHKVRFDLKPRDIQFQLKKEVRFELEEKDYEEDGKEDFRRLARKLERNEYPRRVYREPEPNELKDSYKDYPEGALRRPSERSQNKSPQGIYRQPESNEFKDFHKDSPEETFRRTQERSRNEPPRRTYREPEPNELRDSYKDYPEEPNEFKDSHNDYPEEDSRSTSKREHAFQNQDQEDNEYSIISTQSRSVRAPPEYDDDYNHNIPLSRSPSRQKGDKEKPPRVETVCDKRTRTVTFKDEQGDLIERKQIEEQCRRNLIDWEQALEYHHPLQDNDTECPDDHYTSRSSSSGEHTCIESNCDEDEDIYDSCVEDLSRTNERKPPFEACPCMYDIYCNLTALSQHKSPFNRLKGGKEFGVRS